jgi:hypothetical protein
MSNLRDKILAAPDIQSEAVFIPAWDVTVEVKGLTGQQRGAFLQEVMTKNGQMDFQKMYPLLLILSVFDPETGEPVFKMGDLDALGGKSGAALEFVAQVAQRLSGLNPEATGEAEKN